MFDALVMRGVDGAEMLLILYVAEAEVDGVDVVTKNLKRQCFYSHMIEAYVLFPLFCQMGQGMGTRVDTQ